LNGSHGERRAAARIVVQLPQVVRRVDATLLIAGNGHPQVTGDGEHPGAHRDRIKREHDHCIGAPWPLLVLSLIDAHRQDVDPLGAGPLRQLTRFVDHLGSVLHWIVGDELRQHLRGSDELPHAVEDEQPCHASDDEKRDDQPRREQLGGQAARAPYLS